MKLRLMGAIVVASVVLGACGGGDDGEDAVQRVLAAMDVEGMVYHGSGGGGEVWLDIDDQLYRSSEVTSDGEAIGVGDGWSRALYEPVANTVSTTDDPIGVGLSPRIDDPVIGWMDALEQISFAQRVVLLGERVNAEGVTVVVVEGRSSVLVDGADSGADLVARLELDPETFLLVAFERRQDAPFGGTPDPDPAAFGALRRAVFTVSELIPRSDLSDDFFSSDVVYGAVLTLGDKIETARELGIEPYWFGEVYEDSIGEMALPPSEGRFVVAGELSDEGAARQATFSYAIPGPGPDGETITLGGAVVVKAWPVGRSETGPPPVAGWASVPEGDTGIETARGPAVLFTSFLTPNEVTCPEGAECPDSDATLYRRLTMTIGATVVQLETHARVDSEGVDQNPYNSADGIIALAEAMMSPS